ncbi:Protein of unknown function [Gryllus bimaculatus]|nr:Protein of unknown function [Gryllus bimaculatus]
MYVEIQGPFSSPILRRCRRRALCCRAAGLRARSPAPCAAAAPAGAARSAVLRPRAAALCDARRPRSTGMDTLLSTWRRPALRPLTWPNASPAQEQALRHILTSNS